MTDFDELFLKKTDIIIPRDKWNKLLEIIENHKENIEILKMRIKFFEEEILKLSGSFDFIFIDFDGISELNRKNGYKTVNDIFTDIFHTFDFREDDLVGRWFSGDEIIIITKNDPIGLLDRFKNHTMNYNINFKFKLFRNIGDLESISKCIDTM